MVTTEAGISTETTPLSKKAEGPIYVKVLLGAKVTRARLPISAKASPLMERIPAGISIDVNAVPAKAFPEMLVSPAPSFAERR